MATTIRIVEVGPRDGLQNEAEPVSTADKIAFVDLLSEAGLTTIEVSAFVSPKWIPQLADAGDVLAGLSRRPGVRYTALAPNLKGLERAVAAGADEIAIFASASEGFSRRNINQTIAESFENYAAVCHAAHERHLPVRAYLSTAFGCPYDGAIEPGHVASLTARLIAMGAYEVALSDTIGIAHPGQVRALIPRILAQTPAEQVALHFHDTRGTALANVLAALEFGIRTYDASAGGLGGCPYAPGATGNLATEDLVYMLDGLGASTGVNLDAVIRASQFIEAKVGHALPSRVLRAQIATRRAAHRPSS